MQPYRFRRLEADDLDAAWQLWNSAAGYDTCSPQLLHEKIFADADIAADLRIGASCDDQLVGLIVGVVRQPLAGDPAVAPLAYVKLMAVAPEHRRRGVGRRLLADLEARLAESGAACCRFAESAPNYLTPGLDRRNETMLAFLLAAGYVRFGETYNQRVPLANQSFERAAGRDAATGVAIHRATVNDRDGLAILLAAHWPSWQAEVDRALANDPPSLFLATDESTVIAFSAYDANNVGTGWFGPMGTAPSVRGRGIGRLLLHNCLADIQDQGLEEATIPWVGPLEFYEQHAGARLSRTFDRLQKPL